MALAKILWVDDEIESLQSQKLFLEGKGYEVNTVTNGFDAIDFVKENLDDICASIQERIISILLKKLKKASIQTGITEICIAGGVSANSGLRSAFHQMGEQYNWNTYIPPFEYCTDNAAMIAITGFYKFQAGQFSDLTVSASARAQWI